MSLEDVQSALRSRNLTKRSDAKDKDRNGDGLNGEEGHIRGRSIKREAVKNKKKCFVRHKEGHFRHDRPEKKKKKKSKDDD